VLDESFKEEGKDSGYLFCGLESSKVPWIFRAGVSVENDGIFLLAVSCVKAVTVMKISNQPDKKHRT